MFLRYHLRNIILLSFKDKPLSSYHHTNKQAGDM